jgi:hypothetical protein
MAGGSQGLSRGLFRHSAQDHRTNDQLDAAPQADPSEQALGMPSLSGRLTPWLEIVNETITRISANQGHHNLHE